MASGQILTVKLMRSDATTSWGFRLQGGKEFAVPLSVSKVNPGTLAEQTGLQIGDVILKISGNNADTMRHKEAQDAIYRAGNYLELTVQRGATSIWKPNVTPVGDYKPSSQLIGEPTPLTKTSLAANKQAHRPIGSGHNTNAKPFTNSMPSIVHKQFNSPLNLYSDRNIAETLEAHTEILTGGVKGINFMKPDAPINKESAVYQMVHDEELARAKGEVDDDDEMTFHGVGGHSNTQSHVFRRLQQMQGEGASPASPEYQHRNPDPPSVNSTLTRHVEAPITKPPSEKAEKSNQNLCAECGRLIVGVFVRIKDKSLHAECFRCNTCGTSLKNVGYFNINEKLYCDIHAKQVASLISPGGDILPIPMGNRFSPNAGPPPTVSIPVLSSGPPQSSGLSSPSIVGAIPFHSTQGVHHVNAPSSPQTSLSATKFASVPPPVAPKPVLRQNPSLSAREGNRPLSGAGKFSWPPPPSKPSSVSYIPPVGPPPPPTYQPVQAGPQYNHEQSNSSESHAAYAPLYQPSLASIQSASLLSSSNTRSSETASFASSFTPQSTPQPVKIPPATAPKPQINPPWTGISAPSGMIPGPGQSSIPGSRPAPRRGRGLLKPMVTAGSIPICGTCGTAIRGPFIVALSKTWCPDHFVCANAHCKRSLQEIGFVEEQGRLYCEHCYEAYFAPICAKCSSRIKGDCLNALDKQWHPDCFICAYCKRPFGNSSFYLEDGLPYCEKDWNELFTTKCVGCGFPIEAGDRWVEALNQNYHSNCFKCTVCHKNLEGQSFYAKGGRPFCKSHAR